MIFFKQIPDLCLHRAEIVIKEGLERGGIWGVILAIVNIMKGHFVDDLNIEHHKHRCRIMGIYLGADCAVLLTS